MIDLPDWTGVTADSPDFDDKIDQAMAALAIAEKHRRYDLDDDAFGRMVRFRSCLP